MINLSNIVIGTQKWRISNRSIPKWSKTMSISQEVYVMIRNAEIYSRLETKLFVKLFNFHMIRTLITSTMWILGEYRRNRSMIINRTIWTNSHLLCCLYQLQKWQMIINHNYFQWLFLLINLNQLTLWRIVLLTLLEKCCKT